MNYLDRITINPDVMHGKPVIRNMRFSVTQMLELVASGMRGVWFDEILEHYPYIEKEDIVACLQYAAKISETKQVVQIS